MSQENPNKFLASLTFEVVQANNEANILHAAGVDVASLARDPDEAGLLFTVELTKPVPVGEVIAGWQGYELNDPALPINATVRRNSDRQFSIIVTDGEGGSGSGPDFHLDLTFYQKNSEAA